MKKDLNSTSQALDLLKSSGNLKPTPAKLISLERAVTYYNNYFNTRLAKKDTDQTRAVWFSLELLNNYFTRVNALCAAKNIEITRFVFLLGADSNGKRTILLAPATYDTQLDLHRAFSLDDGDVSYIYRFAGENYSTITDLAALQSTEESLILSNEGYVSTSKAVELYNNYYDFITGPLATEVELDTRFAWYNKGEFEEYITFLNNQAAFSFNGVSFIFGAKNDDDSEGVYANLVTLFFAPTQSENFDLVLNNLGTNELTLTKDTWTLTKDQELNSQKSFFFNFSQSGPPPPDWD